MPGVGSGAAIETLLAVVYGAVGGSLTTLLAFRTRIAMMQRDIDENRNNTDELAARLDARFSKMERRQMVSLQIIADVARKVGADGRFSDQLVRFLVSDVNDHSHIGEG